ncbi:hypothetical protein [Ktedonospora formicarum]|uniref:Uncharacterized protein n=1 Tax=Ktedonospora formicarum TaxID=2778364 RepID=A0A8J3I9S9_9CHLR|nr:hypothetical protein [Ktedonospora formicarum]GHO49440.1 hypothetical protein KSX_76030 [Ktedonospora formicarum]
MSIVSESLADVRCELVRKERRDLLVLSHMAQALERMLKQPQVLAEERPWLHMSLEKKRRTHRVAIYQPEALRIGGAFSFVGFVSQRSTVLEPELINEVARVDQEMLVHIGSVPGLISYSSLELRPGLWYNLVLFQGAALKSHLRGMVTHRYAAYELAPSYYDWIRLHQGTLSGGLTRLRLHSTRYYMFASTPSSAELTYTETEL